MLNINILDAEKTPVAIIEIRFNRSSCSDVGMDCGAWAKIDLKLGIENKKQEK